MIVYNYMAAWGPDKKYANKLEIMKYGNKSKIELMQELQYVADCFFNNNYS